MFTGVVNGGVNSPRLVEPNSTVFEVPAQSVERKVVPEQPKERLNIEQQLNKIPPDKVSKVVESFNKVTESLNYQLKFEFDKDLPGQPIVKIVDKESGKVVREIPPEDFLKMVAKMRDFLGSLFDKKV